MLYIWEATWVASHKADAVNKDYLRKVTIEELLEQEALIEQGLLQYRWLTSYEEGIIGDEIVGIECLFCHHHLYNGKDVNDRWCQNCERTLKC